MKKKDVPTLQELAVFLRNAAYANNHNLYIDWNLSIIHPKLPNGDIGYTGGIWFRSISKEYQEEVYANRGTDKHVSISFSYAESQGITNFQYFTDDDKVSYESIEFEAFKKIVIDAFHIKKLYCPPSERKENK